MASPFPDVRWGKPGSPVSRAMSAFAATRAGSWTVRRIVGLDRRVLERSHGRFTALGPIGAPLLLLESTGRKSGRAVTTPLLYVRDGAAVVVVGSNFGQARHPGWTANLLADPNATVIMAGNRIPVTATPVTGGEQTRLYDQFIETTRVYAVYRTRTDRDLRMFALTARIPS